MIRVAVGLAAASLALLCSSARAATGAAAEPWLQSLLSAETPTVAPPAADPDWHIPAPPPPAPGTRAPRPEESRLRTALEAHLAMAAGDGWPAVPEGRDLSAGERDAGVVALRRRLRASGDYTAQMGADAWRYDAGLAQAVARFQSRHGLPASGIVDATTRAALNVPLADRIAQLAVTLERWRWLPADPGPAYAWVNIGSSSLQVAEDGRIALGMRVIVGHPDRATPAMSGELRQVVFNPAWSVPRTIAVEDLLPRQQEDPSFLASRNFRVFRGMNPQALDPGTVDWSRLGADNFPYRLRQEPGPGNSLGRVKIAWDNPFDIYLHDTPGKGLFGLDRRTLSSGCVRLEDAESLATLLLSRDRPWSADETRRRVDRGATEVLNLGRRLPIYVVYLTAWADEAGVAHFGRDIYGRDARVLAALRAGTGGGAAGPAP